MRFNKYLNSHFASCRLIAEGYDACRSREVRVFLMPGYNADVGFTDGTDAWIVPLAAESCTGNGSLLRGINLRELVGKIFNGEHPPVARVASIPRRRLLATPESPPATIRRRPLTSSPDQQPQEPIRRRHVTF